MQVQVDDRHGPAIHVDLGEQEALLPHPTPAKHHGLGLGYGILGEDRVAVTEADQAGPAIVDPEGGMGVAGMGPQVVQVVETARPHRAFVDLLEGHHVGLEALQEGRNAPEVEVQLARRREALDKG